MRFHHATIWLSLNRARVLHFEAQRFPVRGFKKTVNLNREDYDDPDGASMFFGNVCEAVDGIPELLLTGTPEAIAEFERHALAYAPGVAERIVGVQSVEAPTDARLSALTRWHFTAPVACCDKAP